MTSAAERRPQAPERAWRPPKPLDRRFEAIVFEWDAAAAPDHRLVEELCALGMYFVVVGGVEADVGAAPAGPGRRFFAESASDALEELERLGIGAGLVLVADHEVGPSFELILRDQLERRRRGDVPDVDRDPGWTIEVRGLDPKLERVHEAWLTVADGRLGTRGNPLVGNGATAPQVVLAGSYAGEGPETQLARAPIWTRLTNGKTLRPRRRILDLRTGLLREEGPATALRFSSLERPGTVALRAEAQPELLPRSGRRIVGREVRAALADRRRGRILERFGAYDRDDAIASARLAEAREAGFERLLAEQREAWAARWRAADVVIEGDPALQHAVRFALFHLMGSVASNGEAAVGARGLTGSAYRGHVFWDSDVFVLPFLAATHPSAARAMLEYRVRRLDVSRAAARALGRSGARFAWESAADGTDVTPRFAGVATGEVVPILTGEHEEHIVADVAWAAAAYVEWTGDEAFAAGPGRELLVETARYWASRVRRDDAGRAHIDCVIGPDEYHELIDDNAFTNVIARWNLRRAAEVADDEAERAAWLATADALVDGYDSATGLYEQFAGFYELEPVVIAELAPRRPVSADLLLGAERTRAAQVVKQADVLMLHHLVPDEVAPGSLGPNLDFYEPRTAHGSSLSPAIHASLLAREGRFEEALGALELAARLDLDDLTRTTAGGLHLATMGGLWQALAFGFAGVRAGGGRLLVDPRLPPRWSALELGLRFRGEPFRLRVDHEGVKIDSTRLELRRTDDVWEVAPR